VAAIWTDQATEDARMIAAEHNRLHHRRSPLSHTLGLRNPRPLPNFGTGYAPQSIWPTVGARSGEG
jgi:hypothetical protein